MNKFPSCEYKTSFELEIPELKKISRKVDDLEIVIRTCALKGKATVCLADIARYEGVSVSQLRKGGTERYLLPRFGESAYPTGTPRWDVEEYLKWRSIDPRERHQLYLANLNAEVQKYIADTHPARATKK